MTENEREYWRQRKGECNTTVPTTASSRAIPHLPNGGFPILPKDEVWETPREKFPFKELSYVAMPAIEVLPADEPKRMILGWKVEETIGKAMMNDGRCATTRCFSPWCSICSN